jgi:RNA polymerase sigma factor (sigma-70 family)
MAGVAAAGSASSDRAFERLYQRHSKDVYRYALAVLSDAPDAEDVTQTTFLNAYRSYCSGTAPKEPLNWLIAIAHNVCRQRFRTAARRPREVALDPELAAAAEQSDGYRSEDIRRALAALTFAQRSALAMRELEGRSYREIAEVLELSESAVETLIFRARRAFREQLEGTLTCSEAERAISRQLDGLLERGERPALRAHLRQCDACSTLARRFRAQRSALRGLFFLPLPKSLASFTAGGSGAAASGKALGTGLGIKALALGSAAVVAAGVTTTEIVKHSRTHAAKAAVAPAGPAGPAATAPTRHATAGPARAAKGLSVATTPLPAAVGIPPLGSGLTHRATPRAPVKPVVHVVHRQAPRPQAVAPPVATPAPAPAPAPAPVVVEEQASQPTPAATHAQAPHAVPVRHGQAKPHGKPAATPAAHGHGKPAAAPAASDPAPQASPGNAKAHGNNGNGNGNANANGHAKSNQGNGNGGAQPAVTPAVPATPATDVAPETPDVPVDTPVDTHGNDKIPPGQAKKQ